MPPTPTTPTLKHRFRVAVVLAVTLGVFPAMTACTNGDDATPVDSTVFIAASHANEPLIPASAFQPYLDTLGEGSTVAVVTDEGIPRILGTETLTDLPTNPTRRAERIEALRTGALELVATAAAITPESNPFEALSVAGEILRGAPGTKRVVSASSMLQSTAPLLMQVGLLDAEPADIVTALESSGALPNLQGVEVVLLGVAQVQTPQSALDQANRNKLADLVEAVVKAAGGTLVVAAPPATQPRVDTPHPVTPIPINPAVVDPPPTQPCVVELSAHDIAFLPDSAELRNPEEAATTVAAVAASLRSCPGRVTLTGTTSSAGTEEARVQLSLQRATTVATLLARVLQVEVGTFDIIGLGHDLASGTVQPDRNPDGTLDPGLALSNRKVIISVLPSE